MTPERYQHVQRIFLEVCTAAPADRAAALQSRCGDDVELRCEVEALLATDEHAGDFLSNSPAVDHSLVLEAAIRANQTAARPERIGQYRIIGVLGEGGMGVVYLAEQDNPRRQVALKVIRPGIANAALLKRFEYEAQLLARLQHPGIAQIYQAGTADTGFGPQPFFAMELVRGKTLKEYVELHDLSIRQRLELLIKICEAVHHAHLKGVIHRDLKPGNILVVDERDDDSTKSHGAHTMSLAAQPKILDFGVARATDADTSGRTIRTSAGELLGTLAYMSPEQVSGDSHDVDIRTDVYALGVLYYELLCGRKPHNFKGKRLPDSIRMVQEEPIAPLGTVKRAFRGDLETIVGKALEKDRARRYQSALELAEDTRRFLNVEPIAARPPSTVYRIGKFVRRKPLVAVLGTISVLIVASVMPVVTVFKQIELNNLRTASILQVQMEDPLRPPVADPNKVKAVRRAAEAMENSTPEVAAALRTALGLNFMKLSSYGEARKQLVRALDIRTALLNPPHVDLADSHTNLARVLWYEGRYPDAISQYTIALEMRQTMLGKNALPDQHIAGLWDQLASCYRKLGQSDVALQLAEDALSIRRRLFGENHWEVAASKTNLGMCLNGLGRHVEGAVYLTEALAMIRSLVEKPSEDLRVAGAMTSLADCLIDLDQLDDAEQFAQQALDIKRRGYPANHFSTAATLAVLARLREKQERFDEAETLCREALKMQEVTLPESHIDIAATNVLLGRIQLSRPRPNLNEAGVPLQRALIILRGQLPEDHRLVIEAQALLDSCNNTGRN